uniref:Integrase catalytic domain-containing protein n=1 Tax=Tanacetum cinerariifolium TaxID=118510 RepID=A0A699I5W0_TANCI|nr:hypothetical protein [Tanacetum cinerariifolium]
MLLEGSELTKEDRESQLYDDFKHFQQHKGESIHSYYVWNQAIVQDGRVVVQYVQGQQNRGQGMNPRGGNAAGYGGAQTRVGNVNPGQARPGQARPVKCYNCNEQLLFLAGGQDNAFDDDVDEQPAQDLALNVDNVFQANDYDAFDSDVDEAPTAQTMFMANLSSVDPITDEAGPSYDSNILSEVHDHDQYLDAACVHHEEHVMHDIVQPDHVVDSHTDYTSDSNMIPYDQYVKNNEVPVVPSDVSSVPNDAFKMIYNDIPKPHYNELNRVAIGYKHPLCLTHAKQVQPALYNGHEIIKDNHAPAIVYNIEDTLEIAEITRKKINAKMNDPECVTRKVKIAPHDYSKENFLATFTLQKQLTPEQIFWSNDLIKLKSKTLKERTKVSRPIKALTLYQPNTPATLVPKVLPTKIQVKIHIFTLTQLFSDFDKTCKKRITPTGITERERGFEQTKKCYLKELNYQNLKDGIGNNPPTPDKDTPDFDSVFVIGKMQASLQGKDNVIRQLKKQLFQLQVTRSDTSHTLKVRTTDSQITNLTDQVTNLQAQNDRFRAENDKIKQHYQEFKDKVNSQVLARDKHAIDVEPIVLRLRNNKDAHLDYLIYLKESVETIRDIVEEAKVKQVTFAKPSDKSDSTTHQHVVTVKPQKANVPVPPFTRVISCPNASGSKPKSNVKPNRISPAKGVNKLLVEDQPRTNMSHLRTSNRVYSSSRLKRTVINSNSDSICQTCTKCLTSSNHDMCVATCLQSVVATPSIRHTCNVVRKVKQVWKPKQVRQVWKTTGKVLTTIGHQWRPTGRIFNLGNQYPLTRFTPPKVVSAKQNKKQASCSKHMTGDRSRLMNFMKKFIGMVRFGNDHFGAIMGYGDYVIDGVELIKGSRGSNLYTISVEDMMKSFPICLLSKSSKNKSWLWHRRLNHLNFGKSKKHTHKPKTENTNLEVLNTLHMDLCGQMRVQTINGKKYILVIVDDYSRFTWVKFLRSKDETSDVIIKFITQIQVGLNKTVRYVRTDNGTEFVNHTLNEYYERIGIFHQKTVPRTPQQNGVVERRNRTLVEAAWTMLIFSKAPMFLWAEAVATAVFGALCYPTNDSEDLGKLQPTADTGIFVGPAPNLLTPGQISSGLVPNPVPATPYAPPTNKELKILFQPMFDEYLEPPRAERPVLPAQAVQAPVNSVGTPSSTTIDKDAPSPSISSSSSALQSHSLHQGVAGEPNYMEDHTVAPIDNNPFVNVFALEPPSEASSSGDISSTESPYVSQTLHHLNK